MIIDIIIGVIVGTIGLAFMLLIAINILFDIWFTALGKFYQIKRNIKYNQKIRRAMK